ncbi:reverse transcriptase domain-containing protein [Tanacetum coccineum]
MAPKKRTTRASPATITTTTTTPMTDAQLKALIAQGVVDVLAERNATRSRNGEDSHDSETGIRRTGRAARECTYSDFLKCQPLDFKVACQVKFATCNLQRIALTWWKSHVKTVTHEVAYAMTWKTLKKMMTDKYCPRGKIKKIEIEMWNLKIKGTDVVSYNQRFQELSLMCSRMFPEESDEIEKYVGGFPDMIHGSVMTSKPKTMQEAIEFATELMDKKLALLLNVKLRTRGNLITITKLNNNLPRREVKPKIYWTFQGVGDFAYKLELPQELIRVHNTFHEPVEIMDQEVKRLKQSRIPIIKVRWNSRRGLEFTWEREDQFREKYPHLFTKTALSSSAASLKVNPQNGSNADITKQGGKQTSSNVSAGTLLSKGTSFYPTEDGNSVQASVVNDKWRLLKITLQAPFLNVQMMSDHNSSDLAPQRQEMSVENVSFWPRLLKTKWRQIMTTLDPAPKTKCCSYSGKTDSSLQGLDFLLRPLLEEYLQSNTRSR